MWLFTTDGFFSAVQVRKEPEYLLVRARIRNDLVNLLRVVKKPKTKIMETPKADYPFRIVLHKLDWTYYLVSACHEIDYDNFKSRIKDIPRHRAYLDVWSTMRGIEGKAK